MEKAKKKGEQELVGRREKLMLDLEKLGRRMEEISEWSELDMMQQVYPRVPSLHFMLVNNVI